VQAVLKKLNANMPYTGEDVPVTETFALEYAAVHIEDDCASEGLDASKGLDGTKTGASASNAGAGSFEEEEAVGFEELAGGVEDFTKYFTKIVTDLTELVTDLTEVVSTGNFDLDKLAGHVEALGGLTRSTTGRIDVMRGNFNKLMAALALLEATDGAIEDADGIDKLTGEFDKLEASVNALNGRFVILNETVTRHFEDRHRSAHIGESEYPRLQ
jgi:hypothetical protein